jgi:hypothetical protein
VPPPAACSSGDAQITCSRPKVACQGTGRPFLTGRKQHAIGSDAIGSKSFGFGFASDGEGRRKSEQQ